MQDFSRLGKVHHPSAHWRLETFHRPLKAVSQKLKHRRTLQNLKDCASAFEGSGP